MKDDFIGRAAEVATQPVQFLIAGIAGVERLALWLFLLPAAATLTNLVAQPSWEALGAQLLAASVFWGYCGLRAFLHRAGLLRCPWIA